MPLNVRLNDANFSLGPLSGFFYSCSFSLQSLLQVEADGTVVNTFPVSKSTFRTPITELHFDGTFFWTLEDLPSNLGIVIKRWRLFPFKTADFPSATPTEFRWFDEMSLINAPNMRWESNSFAIEHYHRGFDGSFLKGVNKIRLNDVTNITSGIKLYLGPSSFGGFVGTEEEITVLSVNSTTKDITFGKLGGLKNSYISQDPINFHKTIFLFNDNSFGGSANKRGALINYAYPRKTINFSDGGGQYANVSAADFHGSTLSWVKVFQIIELNVASATFGLSASQESNLVEDDKHTPIEVFDMISDLDNNQYLKLQDRETTEDLGTGSLSTTNFGGTFNFQAQPTLTFVNSVAMGFLPNRVIRPLPDSNTINISTQVRDQFNFPIFNQTIQWSAAINTELSDPGDPGTFSPSSAVTNTSGIAETVYTPSSTSNDIIVDVTADVL
jgi:hypothetical protein